MRRKDFLTLCSSASLLPLSFRALPASAAASGLPRIAGEMHYVRIPRAAWRDRLRMARAMGLTAISTYVFWNVHEPVPETYDFSGQYDVASYLRTAQEEGLDVVLRPGPYICGEWDFGGLPAWLLANPQTVVRTRDERFLAPARRWLMRLGQELAPLQASHGGPIVAMQVENEYGSFGDDHAYVRDIYHALVDAGFDASIAYTDDGIPELPAGSLPELPVAGSIGDPRQDVPALRAFRPGRPAVVGEFYPGWLDHWGEPHHVVPSKGSCDGASWMIANDVSFSFYMFHGGTNFGFMNGANYAEGTPYQPTTTSYDYDAPLDEGGHPTPKYYALRAAIAAATRRALPPVPTPPKRIAIPSFQLDESADWRTLAGKPIAGERPQHMEAYGQSYGYVAYRAQLPAGSGTLAFAHLRDYAVIWLNGRIAGRLDRRNGERTIALEVPAGGATLDVLVENTGRLNYGSQFVYDRKGIIAPVTFAGKEITGWEAIILPMNDLSALRFESGGALSPAFFRGHFDLEEVADTFIDTRELGKGVLWLNGFNLGRFWEIGAQYALYAPASVLRAGRNEVIAFDLLDRSERHLSGRTSTLFAPIAE